MEPARHLAIGSGKWVHRGNSHAILGENEGICHKKARELSAHLTPVKPKIRKFAIENEALNPALVCRAETASLTWITIENAQRSASRFFELFLAKIFFSRYIGVNSLIRYNVVRALTYEKYTTVLCQPISQYRCCRHCRYRAV